MLCGLCQYGHQAQIGGKLPKPDQSHESRSTGIKGGSWDSEQSHNYGASLDPGTSRVGSESLRQDNAPSGIDRICSIGKDPACIAHQQTPVSSAITDSHMSK